MGKLLKTLALACAVLAAQGTSAAPIVTNASFEVDAVATSLAVTSVTGWTVGNVEASSYPYLIDNAYGASTPYGDQFFVPGYYGVGGTNYIEQAIGGFTVGNTYTLSFAIATERSDAVGAQSGITVSFPSGSSTAAANFYALDSGTSYWRNWDLLTYDFLATASSVTVRFTQNAGRGAAGAGYDVGLDNVSISDAGAGATVPEPASLALLGIGLAGLGAARRRKATT